MPRPHKAFGVRARAPDGCLQKRHVNPITSAFPELHPACAGLKMLKERPTGRVFELRHSVSILKVATPTILSPFQRGFQDLATQA
jgi:hypothetical protein